MNQINLVKYDKGDFPSYYQLVSDLKVMAQITERAIPLEEAKTKFQKILVRNSQSNTFGSFKVYDGEEYIGFAHLTKDPSNEEVAEIGYMILPQYWRQGYGSSIAKHLIQLARTTSVKILNAIIDPNNIASRRILINNGFVSEKVCEIDRLPGEILKKSL